MKKAIIVSAAAIALISTAALAADTSVQPGDSSTGAANKNTNSDGSAGTNTNAPGTTINQTKNKGVDPDSAGKSTNSDGSSGATGSSTGTGPAGSQIGTSGAQ